MFRMHSMAKSLCLLLLQRLILVHVKRTGSVNLRVCCDSFLGHYENETVSLASSERLLRLEVLMGAVYAYGSTSFTMARQSGRHVIPECFLVTH